VDKFVIGKPLGALSVKYVMITFVITVKLRAPFYIGIKLQNAIAYQRRVDFGFPAACNHLYHS
jgi:hypothetical protein